MAKITRLNVMISASSKGLSAGIAKANGALDKLSRSARRMQGTLTKAFSPAITSAAKLMGNGLKAVGVAAVAAGGALAYFTKNQIDAIGDTADMADRLGVTYNRLKAIQFAAKLAGIDSEKLNSAFEKMQDTLGSAASGNKSAIDSLGRIGITMEQLDKLSPEKRFEAIGQAIAKIQDPAARIAAARDIFGKAGGALIVLFESGGAAIDEAAARLESFGQNLSDLDIENVRAAGDAMDTLLEILKGIGDQLAANISPYITQIAIDIEDWVAKAGGIGPAMDEAFGGAIDAADRFLDVLDSIVEKWNTIKGYAQTGVGFAFDKIANAGESVFGINEANSVRNREAELQKRAQGIPEAKREEFIRRAREGGGFGNESMFTDKNFANAFTQEGRGSLKKAEEARQRIDSNTGMAGAFEGFRNRAEMGRTEEIVPMPQPIQYKKHVDNGYLSKIPQGNNYENHKPNESEKLLRQIAANTGRNNVAFAG